MREEEKATLETQSLPLRNYLMKFVMPTLTEGLVEVCKVKPDDPVDYLVRKAAHRYWACVTSAHLPLAHLETVEPIVVMRQHAATHCMLTVFMCSIHFSPSV